MTKRFWFALAFLFALTAPAAAQNVWPTPGGSEADGKVQMCLNVAGNAVPISSGQCANGTQPYAGVSAGAGQYALGVASSTALTVPAGARWAEICAEAQAVRYKDDGGTPTASSGIPIPSGTCIAYYGPLASLKFIQESATATLDVSYYE